MLLMEKIMIKATPAKNIQKLVNRKEKCPRSNKKTCDRHWVTSLVSASGAHLDEHWILKGRARKFKWIDTLPGNFVGTSVKTAGAKIRAVPFPSCKPVFRGISGAWGRPGHSGVDK